MSAQPAVNQTSLDSVDSILSRLIELNTEITHLKEELIAKGVPFNTVNALVDLARVGPREEYASLRATALRIAEERLGGGCVSPDVLDSHLDELVTLDEDVTHVRKLARDAELNPQSINMLTQIVRQNPGDRGQRVLNQMIEYARVCGIPVAGVQLAANSEDRSPKSVLPDIRLPEKPDGSLLKYRSLLIEVLLGILLAITALSLLT